VTGTRGRSTTLQCALKFCCPKGICLQVVKGYKGCPTACTEVVKEMADGRCTEVRQQGGRPLTGTDAAQVEKVVDEVRLCPALPAC
jgi:hypothetical protein